MKLYLISQDVNIEYDTYDSAVVCAESKVDAQMTHPNGNEDWSGKEDPCFRNSWADAKDVTVKEIGLAHPDTEVGIVCVSFNPG